MSEYQPIIKLYEQVLKYGEANGPVSSRKKDCVAFDQLFEQLNDRKNGKVVKLLVKLVDDGHIEEAYLLTKCVSQSAYEGYAGSVIKLVVQILCKKQSNPRILSDSSKEPLSRILANKPNALRVILSTLQEEVMNILEGSSEAEQNGSLNHLLHTVVHPFIKYALMKGKCGNSLIVEILDTMNLLTLFNLKEQVTELIEYMKYLYEIATPNDELLTGLHKLIMWVLNHGNEDVGWDFVCLLVTYSWNCLENDGDHRLLYHSMYLVKQLLFRLLPYNFKEEEHCSHLIDECVFVCSMILMRLSDTAIIYQVLQIVLLLLHTKSTDVMKRKPPLLALVLPLLKILSEKLVDEEDHQINALAYNLMKNVDRALDLKNEAVNPFCGKCKLHYSRVFNIAHCSLYTIDTMRRDTSLVNEWLVSLNEVTHPTVNNLLILTSLFLFNEQDLYEPLMQATACILRKKGEAITLVFPLLLFLLRSKRYRESKLVIMNRLPYLAVSKESLPVVLKTILSFSKNADLLPITLHLLTEVWKKQPRVYPYLHQLLSKSIDKNTTPIMLWVDWILAKVTCIVRICHSNASQHGEDMVVILSDILEVSIKDQISNKPYYKQQMSTCLSLLVEALKYICNAGVINIRSIWKAIVMKLQSKQNSLILQSICSLLDCVPSCVSSSNEVFINEVLTYLWFLATYQDCGVQTAAYKTLSKFPHSSMKVKYLPQKVQNLVSEKLSTSKEHRGEEDYDPPNEVIPGYGLMMLLHNIQKETLEGYQLFLTSMLDQELVSLPRGVGRQLQMKPGTSVGGDIPTVLKSLYETNTKPGILPGLSAGLLYCYHPASTVEDTASNKQLLQYKERYLHTLQNLLQDVSVQQNDWHHMMFISRAWCLFMKNMVAVCLEGRKADIELRKERGEFKDDEIYEEELHSVKAWVRDDITDKLRKASKGNPKVQGNSILALVGLANAVATYEGDENNKRVGEQYISTRHWLLTAADTVLVVFNGNYKSKNKPFQWCQQISSTKSTASSLLSRCAAALAFNEMVQPLLGIDAERIVTMVTMLKDRLPGQPKAVSSNALQLYIGLGYGLLVSKLYKEQFEDIISDTNDKLLTLSVHKMEEIVLDDELQNKDGLIVGYGLTLSSIFAFDTRKDSQIYAKNSHKKLRGMIQNINQDEVATVTSQTLLFSFSLVTVYGYQAEYIKMEEIEEYYGMIETIIGKNQFCDLHVSLGLLCNVMLKANSIRLTEKVNGKLEQWKNILTGKKENTMTKLCALKGSISTFGSECLLLDGQINDLVQQNQQLKSVLKTVLKIFGGTGENLLLNATSRLIGIAYNFMNSTSSSYSTVPSNYDYLKSSMLLPVIYSSLIEASITGAYGEMNEPKLLCILNSLINVQSTNFPPVNWTNVFTPLFRVGYSEDVKFLCVQFAVQNISHSKNLALLISSWLQPTIFVRMGKHIQLLLIEKSSALLTSLSNAKQKCLLEELHNIMIKESGMSKDVKCSFESWLSALTMKKPIQSAVAYVMSGLKVFMNSSSKYSWEMLGDSMTCFANCIHIILKDNWRNVLDELSVNAIIKQHFQIEMFALLPDIRIEDIVYLLDELGKDAVPHFLKMLKKKMKSFIENTLSLLCQRFSKNSSFKETERIIFNACVSCLSSKNHVISSCDIIPNDASFELYCNIREWGSMLMVDDSQYKNQIQEVTRAINM